MPDIDSDPESQDISNADPSKRDASQKLFVGNEKSLSDVLNYLGIKLYELSSINSDCDRVLSTFTKQFFSMYSRFNYADKEVLYYLFNTFAT